jgi:hypothetical protein
MLIIGQLGAQVSAVHQTFSDSLKLALNATRKSEAIALAATFDLQWQHTNEGLRKIILSQYRQMKSSGFHLVPELTAYLSAALSAGKKLPEGRFRQWLSLTDSVIKHETISRASRYFATSGLFFHNQGLRNDKSFRVTAHVPDFDFEFRNAMDSDIDTVLAQADSTLNINYPSWIQPVSPPQLNGALLNFRKINIRAVIGSDSILIEQASGSYSLSDQILNGIGGIVRWKDSGYNLPGVVYRISGPWTIDLNKSEIRFEQGRLSYEGMLANPVWGILTFKSSEKHLNKRNPVFQSYESNIHQNRLTYPGLEFSGGLTLSGQEITNGSVSGAPSILELKTEKLKRFNITAAIFDFKDSTVAVKDAAVRIYHGRDSIFHPSVDLLFDAANARMLISKSKGKFKDAPYASSYFGVDFSGERLRWDLKSDSIDIYSESAAAQAPVVIESRTHFNLSDFLLLGGVGFSFHPVVLVSTYAMEKKTNTFFADDLVKKYKRKPGEIQMALDFLAQKGLVDYDQKTGKVTVKERAIHLTRSFKNKSDYDNLKILAVTEGAPNVSMNLQNLKMKVRGVEEVKVSDSLNLFIKPDSSTLDIGMDRDMNFSGKVTAGNFEINGKDFRFKYDSFIIDLTQIDSIRFLIEERNAKGQKFRRRLNNSLIGGDSTLVATSGISSGKTNGRLYINKPDNKSGKKKIPFFPRLDAETGGIVYFDRKDILGGVYGRKIFFLAPPFKLDSLEMADPASINFDGSFITNGIFPVFKERLHAMPDRSLGFNHKIPAAGYNLYLGEGKLNGAINLDNKGIVGSGKIDYLAAHVTSDNFVFYQDSVVTQSNDGWIEEKLVHDVSFPLIRFPEFKLKWIPGVDEFGIKSLKGPFSLYEGVASLTGDLVVSRKGVLGSGILLTRGSKVVSGEMLFASKTFNARHAEFIVATDDPQKPAVDARDVKLFFDLPNSMAEINPEREGDAAINFPFAQYKTSISTARWDLNNQKILMQKDAHVDLENSYFYSTRKDMDSLVFLATEANYDMKTQALQISGIPEIQVADARIIPDQGKILVGENSVISKLKNAIVLLDTVHGYHRLSDAEIEINSRKSLSGFGTYEYVNAFQDTFKIRMSNFSLDTISEKLISKNAAQRYQTVAFGEVVDKDNLFLAPQIYFKGKMTMKASHPSLILDGYVKLDLKRIKPYDTWISYSQTANTREIMIDFDQAITEEGRRASAGIHFATDNDLYVTFITEKRESDHEDFFTPSGMLFFDTVAREFRIEDPLKTSGEKLSGKVLAYHEKNQEVKFEGAVNFFREQKDFKVEASAVGFGNVDTDQVTLNALLSLDFDMPPAMNTALGLALAEVVKNENVSEGIGDATEFLYKLANLIGERPARDYEKKSLQSYFPLAAVPGMARPIVFSSVDLKWSPKHKAFYSEGALGLSHLGKTDINGAFEGFMKIKKNEDGSPSFHLFLKASPDVWFFIGLEDNRLMMHASMEQINQQISKHSNAGKAKAGEMVFIPGSDEETLEFINKYRSDFLQIDTPYDLGGSSSAALKQEKKKDEKDDGF